MLPFIPSTLNLFAKSAKVEEGLVEWDMDKLDELSLWGPPQEDEIDFEEELAKERATPLSDPVWHLIDYSNIVI